MATWTSVAGGMETETWQGLTRELSPRVAILTPPGKIPTTEHAQRILIEAQTRFDRVLGPMLVKIPAMSSYYVVKFTTVLPYSCGTCERVPVFRWGIFLLDGTYTFTYYDPFCRSRCLPSVARDMGNGRRRIVPMAE